MRKSYTVDDDYNDSRLDKWFKNEILNLPHSLLEKILRQNKVKVNKKKTKSSYRLQTGDLIEIYNISKKYKGFAIAISPEGTRKKVERLKSGFLRIANETNSKIMMVGVDFSNKTVEFGDFFSPSGDKDKDLRFVKDYFDNFTGKRPELS